MDGRRTGDRGEALVADYLLGRGYDILRRQYRCRYGEIDLVARQGGVLCFVEVKTRRNLSVALPREAVTGKKQEKLRAAAAVYLSEHPWEGPVRFDVAEVCWETGRPLCIQYWENAF